MNIGKQKTKINKLDDSHELSASRELTVNQDLQDLLRYQFTSFLYAKSHGFSINHLKRLSLQL